MASYSYRRYVSQMFHTIGKMESHKKFLSKVKAEGSCISHQLFKANGIMSEGHPGGFHLLPLGVRALDKLTRLVDQHMEEVGGVKVSLTTLAPRQLWEETGRWEATGPELFKVQDRWGKDYCLGPTHEELITRLVGLQHLAARHLPLRLYQISRKFRDEIRPNKGLFRGREFEMKDMYTFDSCEQAALQSYKAVCDAYRRLFDRLGVPWVQVRGTSGNIGGDLSHEFHYLTDQGQDRLLLCDTCDVHLNKEMTDAPLQCSKPGCPLEGGPMTEHPAIEVGHAFYLGHKYSSAMDCCYTGSDGTRQPYSMGCYGLGVTRILQAGVECLSKEQKIRWPRLLAPYAVCVIPKKDLDESAYLTLAESVSDAITCQPHLHREVVIDDRMRDTIGRRQMEADRLGYPYIVIVGKRAMESSEFELIDTNKGETTYLSLEQLSDFMSTVETI